MKGPKPVWILATKRLSQSRPRPAARPPGSPTVSIPGWARVGRSVARIGGLWPLDDDRPDHLVRWRRRIEFRGSLEVAAADPHSHRGLRAGLDPDQAPIDRDLAAADAEE